LEWEVIMDAKLIEILEVEAPWLYRCGAEVFVDDGWWWLLLGLSRRLEEICTRQETENQPVMVAVEVVEKFGTLRIQLQDAPSEALALAIVAEDLSAMICDCCGEPGRLRHVGPWLRTRCIIHAWELSVSRDIGSDDEDERGDA
jgi:hypothetical protein